MTAAHYVLLALVDSLATLLYAGALLLIARMLAQKSKLVGELAYASFVFTAGSAARASAARLLAAAHGVSGAHITVGTEALLAPGFICLAWALWRGWRTPVAELTAGKVWLAPLFINVVVLGTALVLKLMRWGGAWYWLLISAALVGSVLTFLQLAWRAQERGLLLLALIFVLSFAVALAQSGLLASAAQMPLWIEPLCKVIAQSAFAAAVWQLRKAESFVQSE